MDPGSVRPAVRASSGELGLRPGERTAAPPTFEQREAEVLASLRALTKPLDRYCRLIELQAQDEMLFYRLLVDHLAELLPIVYTPTVGLACQRYSHLPHRPRGVRLTPEDEHRIPELLRAARGPNIRLIVVTDNERILGLGDLGCGGLGIPVGKLALYTAAGGLDPALGLPVSLDLGTDNNELLTDPCYRGYRKPRLRGPEYDRFLEAFVAGVASAFPEALLQWEDFKKGNAFTLLDRYRHRLPSFNDDIQGTGATALAGILAGLRVTGERLSDQRIVFAGAGAAAIGIGTLVRSAMEASGMDAVAINRALVFVDRKGLLFEGRRIEEAYKQPFALGAASRQRYGLSGSGPFPLLQVVGAVRPTVLIGATAQPGLFDQALLRSMAEGVERPIVMPLSNPTSQAECLPANALEWTGGRALVATGSPFPPVEFHGRIHRFGQGNNVFVFPGVGLGCLAAGVREVPDALFLAAACTLASCVSNERLTEGALYPDPSELRSVNRRIAVAVAAEAARLGLAAVGREHDPDAEVARWTWEPH